MKPREFWIEQKWDRLRLDPHQVLPEFFNQTLKKFVFLCDCGATKEISFSSVLAGRTKSCGCKNRESLKIRRQIDLSCRSFGRLTVVDLAYKASRGRSFWNCTCSCGESCIVAACHLNSGHTSSCGCYMRSRTSECNFKSLKGEQFGALTALEEVGVGQGGKYRWKCLCLCGKEHVTYGDSLVQGLTKSCGCSLPGRMVTSPASDISRYIQQELGVFTETEVPVSTLVSGFKGKHTIDIYIPSVQLAVEYHGLPWHSERYMEGKKDREKYNNLQGTVRLIQIYSDEWRDKEEIMKAYLRSLILPKSGKRVKPTYTIEHTTSEESRIFLDRTHYLGAASGCLTVKAHYKTILIGVWVFMKREAGVILWHRACWDHAYKAWNPHEKALKLALPELRSMGFKKMVTFSDNRFHIGELYEKLGFTFEEELKPDYSYTNGVTRKSKYALRVKAGVNEVEAAKEKGWYRIWDSGKKRYSLSLVCLPS